MKRILIFGMTENPGGIESFLLNYYKHIDKSIIQFDFLCNTLNEVAYEKKLKSYGARIFHITARSVDSKAFSSELENLFKKYSSEWFAIWINVCSLANIEYLKMAKKYNIQKRIIHSHNSMNMDSKLRGGLHYINKFFINKYATDFWACSDDAAKWFYNEKLRKKSVVIRNAIDVDKLSFNMEARDNLRKEYNLKNEFVIGNIGRLHFQKNQTFILDIFAEVLKLKPNSKLILIGQGEDKLKLKEKCIELGIIDKVVFAGVQNNIADWLSTFDVFLFPSLFEGLSISALEAQGNGIPVLASDKVIPQEVRMNKNFNFFSLDNSAQEWASKLISVEQIGRENVENIKKNFVDKGYEINAEATKLERLLVK